MPLVFKFLSTNPPVIGIVWYVFWQTQLVNEKSYFNNTDW